CRPADHIDTRVFGCKLHGSVGKSTCDVCEEAPGDENAPSFFYLGRNHGLSRDLVVERGKGKAGIRGLYQDTAQNGKRRALREKFYCKGDGLTEDVTIDLELHFHPLLTNDGPKSQYWHRHCCSGPRGLSSPL